MPGSQLGHRSPVLHLACRKKKHREAKLFTTVCSPIWELHQHNRSANRLLCQSWALVPTENTSHSRKLTSAVSIFPGDASASLQEQGALRFPNSQMPRGNQVVPLCQAPAAWLPAGHARVAVEGTAVTPGLMVWRGAVPEGQGGSHSKAHLWKGGAASAGLQHAPQWGTQRGRWVWMALKEHCQR